MAFILGALNQTAYGTDFDDHIIVRGKAAAYGRGGNDVIQGSSFDNSLYGGDGNDEIYTRGGRDSAWGGRGDDLIRADGETGPVKLYGEAGNDYMISGDADDFLDGGAGGDVLVGLRGKDVLRGGDGSDFIIHEDRFANSVTPGSSYSGGSGHDTLMMEVFGIGSQPRNWIEVRIEGESRGILGYSDGPGGDDFLYSASFTGINEFWAEYDTGTPLLYRGGDSDIRVVGGDQNDIMIGGRGDESFLGNSGDDLFLFEYDPAGMGHDRIFDFSLGLPNDGGVDRMGIAGGEGLVTTVQSVEQGATMYRSYNLAGDLIHTLEIHNIGLPPLGHIDMV